MSDEALLDGDLIIYDTYTPWPCVLITCCNHGNEPKGVEVIQNIFWNDNFLNRIKKWKIVWLLMNPKWYELNKRLIDANMNRIRDLQWVGYEYERKEEIKRMFNEQKVTHCIDLHTMSKAMGLIGICDTKHVELATKILDVEMIWSDDLAQQHSFVGYLNSWWAVWFWLELGQHEDRSCVEYWLNNIHNLLSHLEMIDEELTKKKKFQWSYEFAEELFCNTNEFVYERSFTQLQKVSLGEIIWHEADGTKVVNNLEWDIYFWLATNTPIAGDGIGFLFRKMT